MDSIKEHDSVVAKSSKIARETADMDAEDDNYDSDGFCTVKKWNDIALCETKNEL